MLAFDVRRFGHQNHVEIISYNKSNVLTKHEINYELNSNQNTLQVKT